MITIVLVDDQPAVRAGLRMRLALEADIQIIGEARDGHEALDIVARLKPDIVITDMEMPVMDGLAATREIQSLAPETRVIILTIRDDETTRRRAREAGAAGFVSKHADDVLLLNAIRALANRSKSKDWNHGREADMISTLKWFNVGVRGLMELGIVVALGYWGYKTGESTTAKILLSVGAPLIGFGIWGLVDFRNAGSFAEPLRLMEELIISGLAALAWYAVEAEAWGWALGVVSIIHHLLVYLLGDGLIKNTRQLSF
jgi:CheY-like chemotaxis protein